MGGLVHLRKIDLGANRIREMDENELSGLVNLEELWIGKNKIEQIKGLEKVGYHSCCLCCGSGCLHGTYIKCRMLNSTHKWLEHCSDGLDFIVDQITALGHSIESIDFD